MAVRGPPTGVRAGQNPRRIEDCQPWDSGAGGRVVLSLHARVSDHASSSLTRTAGEASE
jgi:hypothetical protein